MIVTQNVCKPSDILRSCNLSHVLAFNTSGDNVFTAMSSPSSHSLTYKGVLDNILIFIIIFIFTFLYFVYLFIYYLFIYLFICC